MIYREFNKIQLKAFIVSGEYKQYNVMPITPERALSQIMNPVASDEDVLLILAVDEDKQIAGFCGILPGNVQVKSYGKMYWNSCWWVDPQKGRGIAMKLFFRMLKLCDEKMIFGDLTPLTRSILQMTGLFSIPFLPDGFRGYVRANTREILPRKYTSLKPLTPFFNIVDCFSNSFIGIKLLFYTPRKKEGTEYQIVPGIDEESGQFIENNRHFQISGRNKEELEWIIQYPWIFTDDKNKNIDYTGYPFTSMVRSFTREIVKVYKNKELAGVVFFQELDGHARVPYIFYRDNVELLLCDVILERISQCKQIHTFSTFHPVISKHLWNKKGPFFARKSIKRNVAVSKQLSFIDWNTHFLQDGDGDAVFV